MIEFWTFGGLDLRGPDGAELRSVLVQPKRVALLAYLSAATPHRLHRRDSLLALFWPELDTGRARAALRQALHGLRQALGPQVLTNRGDDEVAVDEQALWCDARAFDRAIRSGDLGGAMELYRGDFLEGFFLSGAAEFERWVEEERARLHGVASRAAGALAQQYGEKGNAERVGHWARRAATLVPDDEELLRRLVVLLDEVGDRAGAIQAYEAFARRLAEELEVEPSAETQALVEQVRARAAGPGRGGAASATARHGSGALRGAPEADVLVPASIGAAVGDSRWLRRRLGRTVTVGALAVAGAVVLAAVAWPFGTTRARTLDPNRVVVAPFENQTGDSALDPLGIMAADWITRGLAETGLIEVVDPSFSGAAVASGQRGTSSMRALAVRTRAATVVRGGFYWRGDSLTFEAQISDVQRERVLRSIEPIGGTTREAALGVLRQRVIASLATLFDPKLNDWARLASQPPTFEAYQELLAGIEAFDRLEGREALRHLYHAASVDSSYTLPLVLAAGVHRWLRECGKTDSIARLLSESPRSLARLERYRLDQAVAECKGELTTAYRISRLIAEALPGSDFEAGNLGRHGLLINRPREAVIALERADPERGSVRGNAPYYMFLTSGLHLLGEHQRELEAAVRGRQQYPGNLAMARVELRALAGLGRVDEVGAGLNEVSTLEPHPLRHPSTVMRETALELSSHGFTGAGQEVLRRTIAWLESRSAKEQTTELHRFELAQTLDAAGQWDAAQRVAAQLVAEHPDSVGYRGLFGVLAAQRGDQPGAAREDGWLATLDGRAIRGQSTYWRAAIAARLGERERAVALLREAFGEGLPFVAAAPRQATLGLLLHADAHFASLRTFPPFQELLRPKG